MNIANILNSGKKTLEVNNISNPQLDSEILLCETIKKDKKYIVLNPEKTLDLQQFNRFENLIERRKQGEPIAYLTNKKEFWKYVFYVNEDVLIPRPDTELIIDQVLKIYSKKSQIQVLDMGIGSGCILLSLLKERANFYGTGIDISKKSINVSKLNAKKLHITNRVRFFHSCVDNFKIGKYDLIVSNPPYIKNIDLKYLDKNVVGFEPRLALNGGLEGLSVIQKVIEKSSKLIKKNGTFVLEIAFDQKEKVVKILKKKGFFIKKIIKDLANRDRCITAIKT